MSKEIKDMDFKELRNEVQMLRDALAIMQRKYEDILYNLDDENFSGSLIKEKNGMKAQIEINENEIKAKVSTEELNSTITQTAYNIEMEVSKAITTKFVANILPSNPTDEQKKAFCEYNGKLYYWNSISERWVQARYTDGVKSQFLQTADGFELTGDVKVSGDLIVGGTISGSTLKGGVIEGEDGNYKLRMRDTSDTTTGNFALYNQHYSYNPEENLDVPYFSIYDDTYGGIGLRVVKQLFLTASASDRGYTGYSTPIVKPYGTWDFSHDDVEVIGLSGGTATFG